jgi:hypothetical protein
MVTGAAVLAEVAVNPAVLAEVAAGKEAGVGCSGVWGRSMSSLAAHARLSWGVEQRGALPVAAARR